jgi:hypothetical protein
MTPERLRRLAESYEDEYRGLSLISALLAFGERILEETKPNSTGPREEFYGEIFGLRCECPACGALLWPRKGLGEYKRGWQRLSCHKCLKVWRVGLLIWASKGRPQIAKDTQPPLRMLPKLREIVAWQPRAVRKGKERVNVWEPDPDPSEPQETAPAVWYVEERHQEAQEAAPEPPGGVLSDDRSGGGTLTPPEEPNPPRRTPEGLGEDSDT